MEGFGEKPAGPTNTSVSPFIGLLKSIPKLIK